MLSLVTYQVIFALVALGICYGVLKKRNHARRLPGPRGMPILGNIRDLPPPGQAEYQHWLEFKDKYGPVSSITAGGKRLVIIHGEDDVFNLLEKDSVKTSNRPIQRFAVNHCGFGGFLPTLQYGAMFRQQRKLAHQAFGTKKTAAQFGNIQDIESRRLLLKLMNSPEELTRHIKSQAAAMILKIVYGYSIQPVNADPLTDLVQTMTDNFSRVMVPIASPVDAIPALDYLPEGFPFTAFKGIGRRWKKINEIARDVPYTFVLKQMAEGTNIPSFVSTLVDTLGNTNLSRQDEDAIKTTAAALYGGGADTIVTTITSFVLAMLLFPAVQKKAQLEIDQVVGPSRLPGYEDQHRLPYINAVVKESLRWFPVVPVGPPHATSTDMSYADYHIPKGSYLVPGIWWFLHNPEVYADPLSFDPERFIKPRNDPDPEKHAFGYGRRKCPGRYLAMEGSFITISRLLAAFDIQKAVDDDGREIEPQLRATAGLVSAPKPFPFKITPRSVEYAELIRAVETEHPWRTNDSELLDTDLIEEAVKASKGSD